MRFPWQKDDYFDAIILMLTHWRAVNVPLLKNGLPNLDGTLTFREDGAAIVVQSASYKFNVMAIPAPYQPATQNAGQLGDLVVRDAVLSHQSFITINADHDTPKPLRKQSVDAITRIAAYLADDSVIAMWDTESSRIIIPTPEALDCMRAGKRKEAFEEIRWSSIRGMDFEDLSAEIDEARRRFPEFAAAFQTASDKSDFIVKCSFQDAGDDRVEHMWIMPQSVSATSVTGQLMNDPHWLRRVRGGDVVTKELSEISDWIYISGGIPVGNFTGEKVQGG